MLVSIHISVIHVVSLFLIVGINLCIAKLLLFPTTRAGHASFAGAGAVAICELRGHACAAGVHNDRNEGAQRNWNMGSERRRKKRSVSPQRN